MDVRLELIELNQKYLDLHDNFEIVEGMCRTLTDDWQKSELESRKYKQLYNDGIILHKKHVEQLNEEFKEREKKIMEEKNSMNNQFEDYKK